MKAYVRDLFALVMMCGMSAFTQADNLRAMAPDVVIVEPMCDVTKGWNQNNPPGGTIYLGGKLCGCSPLAWAQILHYYGRSGRIGAWTREEVTKDVKVDGIAVERRTGAALNSTTGETDTWTTYTDENGAWSTEDVYAERWLWDLGVISGAEYQSGITVTTPEQGRLDEGAPWRNDSSLTKFYGFLDGHGWQYTPPQWSFSEASMEALLRGSLQVGAPVKVGVVGHATVCDGFGYDADGTAYFHINLGYGDLGIVGSNGNGWVPISWFCGQFYGDKYKFGNCYVNLQPEEVGCVISGVVMESGVPQENVTVTLSGGELGEVRTATTNEKGAYVFTGLPDGFDGTLEGAAKTYTYTVTANGTSQQVTTHAMVDDYRQTMLRGIDDKATIALSHGHAIADFGRAISDESSQLAEVVEAAPLPTAQWTDFRSLRENTTLSDGGYTLTAGYGWSPVTDETSVMLGTGGLTITKADDATMAMGSCSLLLEVAGLTSDNSGVLVSYGIGSNTGTTVSNYISLYWSGSKLCQCWNGPADTTSYGTVAYTPPIEGRSLIMLALTSTAGTATYADGSVSVSNTSLKVSNTDIKAITLGVYGGGGANAKPLSGIEVHGVYLYEGTKLTALPAVERYDFNRVMKEAFTENQNVVLDLTTAEAKAGVVTLTVPESMTALPEGLTWTLHYKGVEATAVTPQATVSNGEVTVTFGDILSAHTYAAVDFAGDAVTTEPPIFLTDTPTATNNANGVAYGSNAGAIVVSADRPQAVAASVSGATGSPSILGGRGYGDKGTLEKDIYLQVTGGTFAEIYGGSNNNNYSNGTAQNITGDIFVEMTGGSTNVLFGGNHADGGANATLRGDIQVYVSGDATVKGSIVGGTDARHNKVTTHDGAIDVIVKNIQGTTEGTELEALKPGYIVGGGAYVSNVASSVTVTGDTTVTVDLTELTDDAATGTFVKHLVGGSMAGSGGANRSNPQMTVAGASSVAVKAPHTVTFSGNIYGGGFKDGAGTVSVGRASVTLDGGTYTGKIVAGAHGSIVTGNATLTLKNGLFDDAEILPMEDGTSTSATINGENGAALIIDAGAQMIDLTKATVGLFDSVKVQTGTLCLSSLQEVEQHAVTVVSGAILQVVLTEEEKDSLYTSKAILEEGGNIQLLAPDGTVLSETTEWLSSNVIEWTGGAETFNWGDTENWRGGVVPGIGEKVGAAVKLPISVATTLVLPAEPVELGALNIEATTNANAPTLAFDLSAGGALKINDVLYVGVDTTLDLSKVTVATDAITEIAEEVTLSLKGGTDTALTYESKIIGVDGKVKLLSGSVKLTGENEYTGGTMIVKDATLTLGSASALGDGMVIGEGIVVYTDAAYFPPDTTYFGTAGEDAEIGWRGTVSLTDITMNTPPLARFGNSKSTLEVNGLTGYLEQNTSYNFAKVVVSDNSTWTINNGNGGATTTFNCDLFGKGSIIMAKPNGTPTYTLKFIGDASGYTGNVTVNNTNNNNHCLMFGNGTRSNGAIIVASDAKVNISGTWSARTGISIAGTVKGTGTLSSATTFVDGATLNLADATEADHLTISSSVIWPATGKMKFRVPAWEGDALPTIMTLTTADAPAPSQYEVYMGDGEEPVSLYLEKDGTALKVCRANSTWAPELAEGETTVSADWSELWEGRAPGAIDDVTMRLPANTTLTLPEGGVTLKSLTLEAPAGTTLTMNGGSVASISQLGVVTIPEGVTLLIDSSKVMANAVSGNGTLAFVVEGYAPVVIDPSRLYTWTTATTVTSTSFPTGQYTQYSTGSDFVANQGSPNYWTLWANASISKHYTAPGNILRFASGYKNGQLDANFGPMTLGGLIVEEGATGYSLTGSGDRKTQIGDAAGIEGYVTPLIIRENFTISRAGGNNYDNTVEFFGDCRLYIASGKTLTINTANTTEAKGTKFDVGATLKMEGAGQLVFGGLFLAGGTLDLSALTLDANKPPLSGTLSITDVKGLSLPTATTFTEDDETKPTWKIATAATEATDVPVDEFYVNGERLVGALVSITEAGVLSYRISSDMRVWTGLGTPVEGTYNWTDSANWQNGEVPTSENSVEIDPTSAITIALPETGVTITHLLMMPPEGAEGTLSVKFTGGALTVQETETEEGENGESTTTTAPGALTLGASVDVSEITSSFGDVVLSHDATLTVNNAYLTSSDTEPYDVNDLPITGSGTLAFNLGAQNTLYLNGSRIDDVDFKVLSGTLLFPTATSGDGPIKGRVITVSGEDATLKVTALDALGYNYQTGQKLVVENGGQFLLAKRDTLVTPIELCGATMQLLQGVAESDRALDFHNNSDLMDITVKATAEATTEMPTVSYFSIANDVTETNDKRVQLRQGALNILVEENASFIVEPVIYGSSGALNKYGAGELVLTGENSYTSATVIHEGTLKLSGDGIVNASAVTISASATFEINADAETTKTLPNTISGEGTIKISGAGAVYLTGNLSSFTGTVEVEGGTFHAPNSALTFSRIAVGATLVADANAEINLENVTIGEGVTLKIDVTSALGATASPYRLPEGASVTFVQEGDLPGNNVLRFNPETGVVEETVTPLPYQITWMPMGDSITEGENHMGHDGDIEHGGMELAGDTNTRGGYRYQLWKLMDGVPGKNTDATKQDLVSVGFRTGHKGTTDEHDDTCDHPDWAWHAALYGGIIKPEYTNGAQWFNVETALENADYPEIISLMIGINDISQHYDVDSTECEEQLFQAWSDLVGKLADNRPHSKVVVSTILPRNPVTYDAERIWINDKMRECAANGTGVFAKGNVILADVAAWAVKETYDAGNYINDHLHPNEPGSILFAKAFRLGFLDAIRQIKEENLAITQVHNGEDGKVLVRLNKKPDSVTTATLTVGDVQLTSIGVQRTTDPRVIEFALVDEVLPMLATSATLVLNETSITATNVEGHPPVVEILGSGAEDNVPADYRAEFEKLETYNLPENSQAMPAALTVQKAISRVAYYMELKRPGKPAQYVWVSMDAEAFDNDATKVGIPTSMIKARVSNLQVYGNRGNFDNTTATAMDVEGIVEFTPYQWGTTEQEGYVDEGHSGVYGWNDTLKTGGNPLGCMQVARIRTVDETIPAWLEPRAEMLFAYNCFAANQADDLGIGSFHIHCDNSGGTGVSPSFDWTFVAHNSHYTAYQASAYDSRILEVWVVPMEEVTWLGAESGDWDTAANWKDGIMPHEGLAIVLSEDAPNPLIIDDASQLNYVFSGSGKLKIVTDVTLSTAIGSTGGVMIDSGVTVTISDEAMLGTGPISGDGTIVLQKTITSTGVLLNDIPSGWALTDSTAWTGTFKIDLTRSGNVYSNTLPFNNLANTQSAIEVDGVAGHFANATHTFEALIISGDGFWVNNGGSSNTTTFNAKLSGSGPLLFQGTEDGTPNNGTSNGQTCSQMVVFGADATAYTGSLTVKHDYRVGFGTVSFTGEDVGKVLIGSDATVHVGSTWSARQGIVLSGTMFGTGPINSALTFASGATLDATKEVLTASGDVTYPTGESAEMNVIIQTWDEEDTLVLKTSDTDVPKVKVYTVVDGIRMVAPYLTVTHKIATETTPAGLYVVAVKPEPSEDPIVAPSMETQQAIVALIATAKETSPETFANVEAVEIVVTNTSGEENTKGSADAILLFDNVEPEVVANGTTATATIAYDFGIHHLTVKRIGDESYVVFVAKVKGHSEGTTYAEGTSVVAELEVPEGVTPPTSLEATTAEAVGEPAVTGEAWFRVPLRDLSGIGTYNFKVRATK